MDTAGGEGSETAQIDRRSFLRMAGASALLLPAAGGGLSLLLSACGSSSSSAAGTGAGSGSKAPASVANQTFTTPFGFIPSFIETYVAAQLGFWKKLGLNVTIHGGEGTASGLQTVISGSSQYGRGGGTDIIDICNQDIPVIHILQAEQAHEWQIASLPSSPLNKPSDLQGKTIGIVSPGGETQILLDLMLNLAKVPTSSVKMPVVGVGPAPYQLAKSGKIDGWVALDQDLYALAQTGASTHAFDMGNYESVPLDAYVASTSAVAHQRSDVVAFAAGLLQAYAFLKDEANWQKAYTAMKVYSPSTTYSVLKSNLTVLVKDWYAAGASNLGVMSPSQWSTAQDQFYETGAIHKKVAVDRLIDTTIVTDAKKLA